MDEDIARAYLWQEVINLGFSPSGDTEKYRWIHQYMQSLKAFWEIDAYPNPPKDKSSKISGKVDTANNLAFDFQVSARDKVSVQFLLTPIQGNGLLWSHDVDGQYFSFPIQSLLTEHDKRKIALKSCDLQESDIEMIVDGLFCHTRAHQHIELPPIDHGIRIGGGIDNAFLFLFHLRYQLCPIPEKQKMEKRRLVQLFFYAIKNKEEKVQAKTLMAQP